MTNKAAAKKCHEIIDRLFSHDTGVVPEVIVDTMRCFEEYANHNRDTIGVREMVGVIVHMHRLVEMKNTYFIDSAEKIMGFMHHKCTNEEQRRRHTNQ